ncbi:MULTISPECIES: hypothetical protein [unclassified Nocardioides]|uniref:hypothetical protein n=1 Tax=unclassified Nocardioides TaxID=2615069 RepID=UPI0007032036|nr:MULTISPECIES: hypothetical protein [unclassified Nocardioides]KRC59758.1 hypothetical protein ASE19_01695 [Nocardioides sp. Root79]KRC68415.1 hypothetical protein ASE20_16265 [Nocardioides sp. Root240]
MNLAGKKPGSSVALLLVLTVLAGAGLVWQGVVWRDHRGDDHARNAAVEVATDQVLDLTTLDTDTIDAKVAAMGKRLSGDFKRQFDGFSQTFADVVANDKIRASGKLKSVAVSAYDGRKADVLVATTVDVTTGKATKPTQRDYRMKVSLEGSGDDWLITGMEFVA